jgi:hypothetical protein
MRSRQGNGSVFVNVNLPSGETEGVIIHPNLTVSQVKESIIKQCPTLFAFDKDTLAIALNKDEPLSNVNATFSTSHPTIQQQLESQLSIELFINPITADNIKLSIIESPLESPKSENGETKNNQNDQPIAVTEDAKQQRKSYRQSRMFFSTPDLIRESYLFTKPKKKRGKYDKRYFCVTEDYNLLIYKDEHETTPLETILLSICSVAEVEGRKDFFELSYDNKTIKIHSPDVREVTDWYYFFVNSLHYAQKKVSTDPAVDMEGFVNIKEERSFSSSKLKWCVLKHNRLLQYKSQMAARLEQDKFDDVISLDDCLIRSAEQQQSGGNALCFYLVTPTKVFGLYCKTSEDLRKWIVAMNSSRKKFRLQKSSPALELPIKEGSPVMERLEFTKISWAGCKTFQRKILQLGQPINILQAPEVDQIVDSRILFKMIGEQLQPFKFFTSRIRSRVLRTKHLQGLNRLDVPLAQITHVPLPGAFPAILTVHFRFAETKIFLALNLRSKALNCPIDTRLDTAVETLLKKAHVNADNTKDIMDSYVVKVFGRREYVTNLNVQLKDLVFVRENVKRRRKVELALVEKAQLVQAILENEKKYSSYFADEQVTLVENPRLSGGDKDTVLNLTKSSPSPSPRKVSPRYDANEDRHNVLYEGTGPSVNPLFEGKDKNVSWNKIDNTTKNTFQRSNGHRKINSSIHRTASHYNHYQRAPVKYVPKGTAKTNNSNTNGQSPVPPLNLHSNGSSQGQFRSRKNGGNWAGATYKPGQTSPISVESPATSPRAGTVGAHRSPVTPRRNAPSPTTSSTPSKPSGIVAKHVKSFTDIVHRMSAEYHPVPNRLSKQMPGSPKSAPTTPLNLKDLHKSNSLPEIETRAQQEKSTPRSPHSNQNNQSRSPRQKQINYVPKQTNTETFPNKEIVSPRGQHGVKQLEALEVVQQCIDVASVDKPFEVMIQNLENFNQKLLAQYFDNADSLDVRYMCSVELALYYGGALIETPVRTNEKLSPYWNQILQTKIKLCNLPRETRLGLTVYCSNGKTEVPIGWVNHVVTDLTGRVKSGSFVLKLWEREKSKSTGNCDVNVRSPLALKIQFEESSSPLVYSSAINFTETMLNFNSDDHVVHTPRQINAIEEPEELVRHKIQAILKRDALVELNDEDKLLIWEHRFYVRSVDENSLAKVCMACDWTNKDQVAELHALLKVWHPIDPINALELLDFKFSDTLVREFAVKSIKQLSDDELYQYLLQLVQVLKHEPFHLSALAMFLIERAMKNPPLIAHALFWHLQAEMENPEVEGKYGLLVWFLIVALPGSQRTLLIDQVTLVNILTGIHSAVFEAPPQARTELLRKKLTEMSTSLPASFALPINSSMVCKGLVIDRCRVLNSATVPLWLVFENEDTLADPIQVIFKCGDDMRQDVLTLQMFAIMDRLWKEAGLDFQMTIYRCVATGWQTGMLEAVLNADTTAKIQKEAGGVTGAFNKKSITNWLEKHNSEARLYSEAVENFLVSCASYCVATYVIGIGDRHNDNIMVCKSGQLFHIDFAHFLGNIMKFGVYKREKAPFVLTPDFVYVLGGEKSSNYARFIKMCQDAYCILRKHANTFINLFVMMLLTGIPQLRELQDVTYLKKAFSLAESEDEARVTFARLIDESLNTKTTQINFALHILANPD